MKTYHCAFESFMTLSTFSIITFAIGGTLAVIDFTFLIYCLIQLNKHKHQQFFEKRRKWLVLTILITLFMLTVLVAVTSVKVALTDSDMLDRKTITIFSHIEYCLYFFGYLFPTISFVRIWLSYYDMQISQLIKNQSWQMAINPNIESKSWFLNPNNQRKYQSDGRYLIIIAIILSLTEAVTFYVLDAICGLSLLGWLISCIAILVKVEFVFVYIMYDNMYV